MSPKLFAVTLGGKAPGCNIELHDVVFVVGETIEETYPKLAKKWFGNPKKVHIDSYMELDIVDGHQVVLTKNKPNHEKALKLYFINFGGYRENFFGEIHESGFYVGQHKNDVLKRARHDLCVGTLLQHRDDFLEIDSDVKNVRKEVDDILEVNSLDGYSIELVATHIKATPKIVSDYIKLEAFALEPC